MSRVDAPPAAAGTTHRRGDIQGLRAIAVILVVAFHAGLAVDGGFTGVDVFFVISGFVITAMLFRERETTDRTSFREFYSRRARRILPALALTVTVTCLLAFLAMSPLKSKASTARTGVAAMFSVANFYLYRHRTGYFGVDQQANALLHTWSLSVEEQFYLVFPALLVAAWWFGRRYLRNVSRRVVAATVIAIGTVVSFALCVATTSPARAADGTVGTFAFYMAPARAWEFGAGALVALSLPLVLRIPKQVAVVLGVLGLVIVGIGAFAISATTPFPGTAALLPVVGTALLLAGGAVCTWGVPAVLAHRSFQWVGDVSYSWYLWHWPMIVFALAVWPDGGTRVGVSAALFSLLPAWLAYRFVENPIRRRRGFVGRRAVALATVCIVIPVIVCVALAKFEIPGRPAEATAFLVAAQHRYSDADGLRNCATGIPIGKEPARCTWRVPNSRGTIALVGDSEAGTFTEPAVRAARRLGYDFTVGNRRACSFAEVLVVKGRPDRACLQYVRQSVADLVRMRPSLVLMASSVPYVLNPSDTSFQDIETGKRTNVESEKAKLWADGVRRVVQPLSDAGIPTVIIHTIPQFVTWTPDCAAIRLYLDVKSCGKTRPRAQFDETNKVARQAENDGIKGLPLASTVDFADQICSPTVCRVERDGLWMYRDGYHLSWAGALTLVDDFGRMIAARAVPTAPAASPAVPAAGTAPAGS